MSKFQIVPNFIPLKESNQGYIHFENFSGRGAAFDQPINHH